MTSYLILFSANLSFIITHLYGWLLKWRYRPAAYKEHFDELFPAQNTVAVIYLLQVLELPYLFQIGDRDALLYVNAFALLFFSIQMLIMCDGYFFPKRKHNYSSHWLFVPAIITLLPMFLQAVGLIHMPDGWRNWFIGAVTFIFLFYFWRNIHMALRIKRAVRLVNEDHYADSDDFPVSFANLIRWVPTGVLILLAINFYADSPWVKFGRDILFIAANIWFCILTLNPWRKIMDESGKIKGESAEQGAGNREQLLSDSRYDNLARRLEQLLTEEKVFTEQHINVDLLTARLGTNSKYLSEVIHRSGYQSFYDMICQHRVRHAISLIHQNPEMRLSDVAADSGFSSQASMTKAFKSQGKQSPTSYR